jgi:hypothetical protein
VPQRILKYLLQSLDERKTFFQTKGGFLARAALTHRQLGVNIPDFDTTLNKAFVGLTGQPVPFVFGDHNIKRPVNGFCFGAGFQEPLSALDLGSVQAEMFV